MAEHSGFFNGDQEYGQEEFNRYFDNIYESGVSVNSDNTMTLNVTTSGMNILVGAGFAIIKGFYLYNDSTKTIIETADSNYNRIDRVVLRLNLSSSKVSIELKKGTPASNPVAPVLQRDNIVYELSLAQILVGKDNTLRVTDERYVAGVCGSIRPKNLIEFNAMIAGLQERFNVWFNKLQAPTRNIYLQNGQPVGAKEGDIWIQTT
ncbi:hypothetical protein [Clostridium cadaveris]